MAEQIKFIFDGESSGLEKAAKKSAAVIEDLRSEQQKLDQSYQSTAISAKKYETESSKIAKQLRTERQAWRNLGHDIQGLDKDLSKLNRTTKRRGAGIGIQELSRGIADFNIQGGFKNFDRSIIGATNNIERFAEIMGDARRRTGSWAGAFKDLGGSFFGPYGIIAGVTLLISFMPDIIQHFRDFASETNSVAREAEELNDRLREQYGLMNDVAINAKDQDAALTKLAELNKEISSLEGRRQLAENNPFASTEGIDKEIEQVKKKRAALLKTLSDIELKEYNRAQKEKQRKAEQAAKEHARLQKEKQREAEKAAKEAERIAEERARVDKELLDLLGNPFSTSGADNQYSETQNALGDLGFTDFGDGIVDDVEVLDELIDSEEELNEILRERKSIYASLSAEQGATLMETLKGLDDQKVAWEDVADSASRAFASAFGSSGSFLENLMQGIFQTLGDLAIKEGSFHIAAGIAKNTALPGSGVNQIAGGAALIAAGTAIKAGGSAIAGKSGSSGKANVTPERSEPRSQAIQTQSDTANNAPLQAIAKVKGQDLILSIENAQYSRRGYLPN